MKPTLTTFTTLITIPLLFFSHFAFSANTSVENAPTVNKKIFMHFSISPSAPTRIAFDDVKIQRLLFDETSLTVLGQKGKTEFFVLPKKTGRTTLFAVLDNAETVGLQFSCEEKFAPGNFFIRVPMTRPTAKKDRGIPITPLSSKASDYVLILQRAAKTLTNAHQRDQHWQKVSNQAFFRLPSTYQNLQIAPIAHYQNHQFDALRIQIQNTGLKTNYLRPDFLTLANIAATINVPSRLVPAQKARIFLLFARQAKTHS